MDIQLRTALFQRLINQPTFMHAEKLHILVSMIDPQNQSFDPAMFSSLFMEKMSTGVEVDNGIATIPVQGPIFTKMDALDFLFGCTSYEQITKDFKDAIGNSDVEKIVFMIDTPGGEASGMVDCVDDIFDARGTKPIISMINDSAYSAGYGIASAADEIIITRTGGAGSIGSVAVHVDQSKRDEQMGLKYTYIYAGARKIDGVPHKPLSEEAEKVISDRVNEHCDMFIDQVSRNLDVPTAKIRAMDAGVFMGQKAVSEGLAHKVMRASDAINSLRTTKKEVKNMEITLAFLQEKHADIVKQISDAAVSGLVDPKQLNEQVVTLTAEKDWVVEMATELETQNTALKTNNDEMGTRVLKLEKADTIRDEQSIKDKAGSIWSVALAESGLPERVHDKAKSQVTHSRFVKEGVFDEAGFTTAVKAEIEDWSDFVDDSGGGGIHGSGNGPTDSDKVESKKDDDLADNLFAFVGNREAVTQ